jgi:hypothetical protein
MFNFEKLGWWQHAIEFVDAVYEKTRSFPREKQFGLTNQMRRAAWPRRKSMAQAASSVGRKIRIASSRFHWRRCPVCQESKIGMVMPGANPKIT